MNPETNQLVVGTAGHIDHGKSRLVLALTGVDPDRLPEEKARGMTIDLGFAHAEFCGARVSFVDVPGHERFIHNMVAGTSGVDAALLVVAADDSVMPQTREHAELLKLLGVERCVVALTKMDLVDDGRADQVEREARELLAGVGLAPQAVVRTSAETGRGLDDLRQALARLAVDSPPPRAGVAWFRMPIDRAFTIRGRGTVVTGTVLHGGVARDDELELWPVGQHAPRADRSAAAPCAARRVRVRDLQSHADPRTHAAGRLRLALNLAGLALQDAARGFELATPGYLAAAQRLDVELDRLRTPGPRPRRTVRVRLHLATSEVLAELRLAGAPPAAGPYVGFAQVRTAVPIVAAWGQRFIVRDEAAQRTLGGGRVVRAEARPWNARNPPDEVELRTLVDGPPEARAEAIIRGAVWNVPDDARLAALAGLGSASAAAEMRAALTHRGRIVRMRSGPTTGWLHVDHASRVAARVAARLAARLAANPRLGGVPPREWPAWMPRACPASLRPALADWLVEQGVVQVVDGLIVPAGFRPDVAPQDRALLDAALEEFRAARFHPPAFDELRCRNPRNAARLRELIRLAESRGWLVCVAPGLWLHADCWAEAVQRVRSALQRRDGLTVADVRDLLGSSRKFVVPIVEHLDRTGVTRRDGDLRRLRAEDRRTPPPSVQAEHSGAARSRAGPCGDQP